MQIEHLHFSEACPGSHSIENIMLKNSLFDTVFFVVRPLCMIKLSQNKVIRNKIFEWHRNTSQIKNHLFSTLSLKQNSKIILLVCLRAEFIFN